MRNFPRFNTRRAALARGRHDLSLVEMARLYSACAGTNRFGCVSVPAPTLAEGTNARVGALHLVDATELLGRHQHRCTFVLYEENHEFCRFGFARVPPNYVHVVRAFVKGLTRG